MGCFGEKLFGASDGSVQTSARERLLRVEINETSRKFLRVENESESSEEKNSFGTKVLNLQMRV